MVDNQPDEIDLVLILLQDQKKKLENAIAVLEEANKKISK